MKPIGIILLVIGVSLLFVSCNMITSVGGYHNVGLISNRDTLTTVAAAISIIGTLLYIFNRTPPQNTARVKCPFCAEDISAEATLCKHCHSDISLNNKATTAIEPKPTKPLSRDGLNTTYSVNIVTKKSRELIHTIAAEELSKINKHINPETLIGTKNGFVNLEATLAEQQSNEHRLLISYVTQKHFKITFMASAALIISYIINQEALSLLHGGLISTAITTYLYIESKSITKRITTAAKTIKSRAESN